MNSTFAPSSDHAEPGVGRGPSRVLALALALVLFAGAGCDSSALAPGGGPDGLATAQLSQAQAGAELPFRVELTLEADMAAPGAEGSAPRCTAAGLFTLFGTAHGTATYLGKVSFPFSNCTEFPIPGPVDILDGMGTLVAANGDGLSLTYTGSQGAVDMETFAASYEVDLQFEGGSGRFESATGAVQGGGTVSFAPDGVTTYSGKGWISFGASDRRP